MRPTSTPVGAALRDCDPRCEVGDAGACEHCVGSGACRRACEAHAWRAPQHAPRPSVARRCPTDGSLRRARQLSGSDRAGESLQPSRADELQVGVVGRRLEHPLRRPFVEVASRGVAGFRPERNVLAVAPAGQRRRVDPSGMRAEGRLYDREHAVRGDAAPGGRGPPKTGRSSPPSRSRRAWPPKPPMAPRALVRRRPRCPARRPPLPCTSVTSGASGATSPSVASAICGERRVDDREAGFSAIDEPTRDPVTTAGRPRAAASRRWT